MMERLHTASDILKSALEQYLGTCLAIYSQYEFVSAPSEALDTVLEELQTITSYQVRLLHSKRVFGKLRNRSGNIVPINSLPPELLSHIFHFTYQAECTLSPKRLPMQNSSRSRPQSSISLLHICSHWRSIALRLHTLWTHIDIIPDNTGMKLLLDRPRLFASSSGNLPLTVHVKMEDDMVIIHGQDVLDLLISIAARAEFINFHSGSEVGLHVPIIETLLANCTPGQLTRLEIYKNNPPPYPTIIVPCDMENPPGKNWQIGVAHHRLEQILQAVTVLRLENVYPYWTSQAYSGLVELQLLDDGYMFINTSTLASVLSGSPQLRFFSLRCIFLDDDDISTPDPVTLGELEVLHLGLTSSWDEESVMSIISPGLKPLRMTLDFNGDDLPSWTEGAHRRFFQHSNVVELHSTMSVGGQQLLLPELLELAPNLSTLSLTGFEVMYASTPRQGGTPPGTQPSIRLHLVESMVDLGALYYVAENYSIEKLTIDPQSCKMRSIGGGEAENMGLFEFDLLEMCPRVEFLRYEGPREADWD